MKGNLRIPEALETVLSLVLKLRKKHNKEKKIGPMKKMGLKIGNLQGEFSCIASIER